MASDESMGEGSSALPSEDNLLASENDAFSKGGFIFGNIKNHATTTATKGNQVRTIIKGVEEPEEHRMARDVVTDCLDKGQDSIDLR